MPLALVVEEQILIAGAILALAVVAAVATRRLRLPLLVTFLGLGMLLGSEGVGGIYFDDAQLARSIGVVGLLAILFEGGLTTDWRDIRPVLAPACLLSTLGVAVTAAITGATAYALLDLSPAAAFLLGAVVGSTDAAAVFATLRFTTLLEERGFTRQQAYVICSVAVDLRVSNVVDVPNYVVSALLPEAIFGD